MSGTDPVRDKFDSIVRKHLMLVRADEQLPWRSQLLELGLDSMRAIDLLIDLEQSFEVTFPDSMLDGETFYSAATLERAVRTLLGG